MDSRTTVWSLAIAALLIGVGNVAAGAAKGFAVDPKNGFVIKLNGAPVAHPTDPKRDPKAKIIREKVGFTVLGDGIRKEYAIFEDRLEYTFDFALPAPAKESLSIVLPLPKGATATVTHGRTHPAPPKKIVYLAGKPVAAKKLEFDVSGPSPPDIGGEGAVFPLRYVTVKTDSYALAVDVHPAGAGSEDPSYAESPLRIFSCRQTERGVEIVAKIPAGYSQYRAHLQGKIIFYADGRAFEKVHPFAYANEYGALEKYVWLDFTNGPGKGKGYAAPCAAEPYEKGRKYGWVGATSELELKSTTLKSAIHGTYITSRRANSFRVDAPPGYYYVTLNFGNADGPTGPLRVSVNDRERLARVELKKGRFRNELLLVKTDRPGIEIELSGIGGAPWLLNGLAVEPLGTLNEDFVFTRPWWNFKH